MKIGTIQALACVGLGTLLGFVAATRGVNPSLRAEGATRQTPAGDEHAATRSCCSDGAGKAAMLAAAEGETLGPATTSAAKKPNIVVIMGDDIGWFNIGAYHRGMMAGRTPNLDKLAAQGMLFTDYYAEASCTAGRANFITGQLPIRTGMTTVGQAGSPDRAAGAGADHRHGAEVDGLRHRPVRQEPPGRPQRVPADGPRLRRVLRLPLSPRRDGRPVASQLSARAEGQGRPAQHAPLLGDRSRRSRPSSRAGARSASRRSRTPARSIPSGWRPWTTRSSTRRSSSSTRPRATTSRSSSGSTRRGCTSSPTCPTSTRRPGPRRTAGRSTRPAWRSSTTSSARS